MSFSADLDHEREQITRAVRTAAESWAQAMRGHKLAPPDAGFAGRLRSLAEAAAAEQAAWEQASAAGLRWRPLRGSETAAPPYELRPGTGRRGPAELWLGFDRAVAALNRAIAGPDANTVAAAFGVVADVAAVLADAVARDDETGRARGAA